MCVCVCVSACMCVCVSLCVCVCVCTCTCIYTCTVCYPYKMYKHRIIRHPHYVIILYTIITCIHSHL